MGRSKKKKTVKKAGEITDDSIPRSFIFQRGEVGKLLQQLILDMRHVMQPYTATNLKVKKNNVLKDFVHVAGPYGISHFITFSKTDMSPYMKIVRLPRGPTLTFKLEEYSLMRDVVAILKRPKTIGSQFKYPPLVVLNNFNTESAEMKLMTTVFQNMFPAIKVQKVKLSEIRRCAMFNYDTKSNCIDFRQYNIEAAPVGVSRGVKKLLKNKIPNLGSLNDISDFMTGAAYLSESEGEEPMESHVTLPQRVHGRGNLKTGQSAIKLTEMGPRLKFSLLKIEDGVSDGEVLYHKYVQKSVKEKKALKKKKHETRILKEHRKREQEANVARKDQEKEENKKRSIAGMKRKAEGVDKDEEMEETEDEDDDKEEIDDDDDDDAEYYRQEVGDEPDVDFQPRKPKRKQFSEDRNSNYKKKRMSTDSNKEQKNSRNQENFHKKNKFEKSNTRTKKTKTISSKVRKPHGKMKTMKKRTR